MPKDQFEEYLLFYRKLKGENRPKIGFILLGIGGFIGFISCIGSMVFEHKLLNSVFLYGCTSLAIIVVMCGLYYIFED